jgi:hypothetical protein
VVVAAKDITRADVQRWIDDWKGQPKETRSTLEDWVRGKVDNLVEDPTVTSAEGEYVVQRHLANMILDDLESYDA